MSPLVNLSEGTPFAISKSSLKACPLTTGIVCVSTAMIAVDEGDVEDLSRRLFGVSTGARHPSAIIQSFLLSVSDEHVWCFPTYVG